MAEQDTWDRRSRSSGEDEGEGSHDRRRGGRGGAGGEGGGGRRDRFQKRRHCPFCADRTARIDYKDSDGLRYYTTDHGKIRPRRQTGVCARHQRVLGVAIKRARHLALLPFVMDPRRRR